jgi:protein-S-isoprenylcysteine O-methyltransferase Ste14
MTERSIRLLATTRLVVVYLLVGALLFWARPTPLDVALGAPLVLCGELLRLWAAGHLVKNETLVTAGPYRYTRNPLYLGRLTIFVGLCVMARLPHGAHWGVLVAGLVVFFGYYLPRKERVEPARLLELHGESFERYRREVPALLPLHGAWKHGSVDRWSWSRALANREHWMVLALAAVVAFLLWRSYSA